MNTVKIIGNEKLTPSTFMLTVERPDIEIKAGQCFNIGTNEIGVNREYSMYSDANADYVQFLIKEVEFGVVSPCVAKLAVGDEVELEGPFGEFCIENAIGRGDKSFTFIGTGTGIAPFRSFVKSFPTIEYKLIHGIRFEEERYHHKEYKTGSYTPCVSRPSGSAKPEHVTDFIRKNPIENGSTVFICGNRKMISEVFDICREQGINGDQIFTEVFF
jgi:ferredoxin--NADP+ reductase